MPRKPKNFGQFTFMEAYQWYKDNNVPLPKSYKPGGRYYKAWKKYGVDKGNQNITIDELRGHGKPLSDRLMRMLAEDGQTVEHVRPRNLKERSKIGTYWNDLNKALDANEEQNMEIVKEFIKKYRRKTWTDADGKKHRFPTNLKELDKLQYAGELRFGESIYVMEVPA